jgi:hypothetical protein
MFPWKLSSRLLNKIARRPGKVADLIFHLSEVYQIAYKNVCYDFAVNGETWLLDRLKNSSVEMIFDVGANHGEWSAVASERFPNAEIHAFEIVPATYNYLEDAAHRIPNMRPNPFGLADHTGLVDVSIWQDNDTVSSILNAYGIRKTPHGNPVCSASRGRILP